MESAQPFILPWASHPHACTTHEQKWKLFNVYTQKDLDVIVSPATAVMMGVPCQRLWIIPQGAEGEKGEIGHLRGAPLIL